jgi:ACS family D-galactonate transporter-like MFS transporter
LIARGHDAVLVRKSFVVAGFIGGTTVLLGAYAGRSRWRCSGTCSRSRCWAWSPRTTLTLCKLTLIPKPAIGLNTGLQQVATSLAGGVSASLSGWLLHVGGSYKLPMMAIFGFLVVGATIRWCCCSANGRPGRCLDGYRTCWRSKGRRQRLTFHIQIKKSVKE